MLEADIKKDDSSQYQCCAEGVFGSSTATVVHPLMHRVGRCYHRTWQAAGKITSRSYARQTPCRRWRAWLPGWSMHCMCHAFSRYCIPWQQVSLLLVIHNASETTLEAPHFLDSRPEHCGKVQCRVQLTKSAIGLRGTGHISNCSLKTVGVVVVSSKDSINLCVDKCLHDHFQNECLHESFSKGVYYGSCWRLSKRV